MSILISGYYGFGNLGDELILHALVRAVQSAGYRCEVLSHTPTATGRDHGVASLSRWNLLTVLRAINRCRVLISGGGGLVQDLSGPWTPLYYLGVMALAGLFGRKVVVLGQGIGPLKHWWNRVAARMVFKRAALVIPRDRPGYAWCAANHVRPERLRWGADLAWLLPAASDNAATCWVVCLRADWMNAAVWQWLHALTGYAAQQGKTLRFVAIGNQGDGALLGQLQAQNIATAAQCFCCTDMNNLAGEKDNPFRHAELVLSMRYHGLILGALSGAVVSGFGKDDKLSHLLTELDAPAVDLDPNLRSLRAVEKHMPLFRKRIAERRLDLQHRAQEGMRAAIKLLHDSPDTL